MGYRYCFVLGALAAAAAAVAQATAPGGQSSVASSTRSFAATTTLGLSVDDLWDLFVGPVSNSTINTTVEATPIPTAELIPPPPLYYSPFPSGQQNPLQTKNESWSFPKDFWWGVASAAYQIEGAVKAEGRGPSVWDVLTHRVTNFVKNNDTGDIGDNEYYLYKQDIARIAALGVPYYSFSISWSRIFPFGSGPVNELGLKHYDDLIDTCLQYNVQPVVTLYHWDTPLYLQNTYGGWLSPSIVPDFVEYARVAFTRWGNKVPHWFTVNEPLEFCAQYPFPSHYFKASSIPAQQQPYHCGHNVLLAHSQAYRLGKSLNITGTISFKNNGGYKIPLTNSSADALAVQRAWDFNEGWFATPTFLTGDYPTHLKAHVSTFLPDFTDAQKQAINGSADLFAHDAYTSNFFSAPDAGIDACLANTSHPLYPGCYNQTYAYAAAAGGWNVGPAADPGAPWLHYAMDWVPALLRYIQDTWKPAGGIVVSEFGFAEPFEELKTLEADIRFDPVRSAYYVRYLEAVLMAIAEGVDVRGCLAWSIVDNLEWASGFTVKFGMQYFNLTTLERSYKASFFEYVNVFKQYLPA
ncbi:glycoside hydrolase family 1 protein [Saccharata proteae CBS 121410]|uniref:Glycoside hydrolase family 1 protein n=1 Tax=Saccharata proteae CBS 121410 TaxID=1314787 RepID=A0A9P4HTK9_9PEZI|nr:glycoside hydrolase family 1 protein [Saccharata proteae CBS 121410]